MTQYDSETGSDAKQQDNQHEGAFQNSGYHDGDSDSPQQDLHQRDKQERGKRSFQRDRQLAVEAGRKGGRSQNASSNSGNFKHDPKRASEAGRKGGQNSRRLPRA